MSSGVLWRVCDVGVMDWLCDQYWWSAPIFSSLLSPEAGGWGFNLLSFSGHWLLSTKTHLISIINSGAFERGLSLLFCCPLDISLRKSPGCLKLCQESGRKPTLNSYCITVHTQPLCAGDPWLCCLVWCFVFLLYSLLAQNVPLTFCGRQNSSYCQTHFQHCLLQAVLKTIAISYFLVPVCSCCLLCIWLFLHCSCFKGQRLFSGLVR